MKRLTLFALITFFAATSLHAQTNKTEFKKEKAEPRSLPAKRTTHKVKIDGLLNDSAWRDAAIATNYIEFRPKVGRPDDDETKTVTYLMYDNEGFYFGGYCYERSKDSITTELIGKRDGFGTNDYIGIIIDTYKDHLNGFEYFVTPLNEQWDSKMSPVNSNGSNEDFSWNAVWKSGAVIHDNGWSFEMFIPYSAIRFGKNNIQDWGINMTRRRQKTGQQNTWNPIDPNVNGFLTQEGYWTGIADIKPPVRLQLSPYFSVYANNYPVNQPGVKNTTTLLNGGLDLKYGLNQAFTLDATLIPDFGQVQSDNQVLNLSPFEVQYNEYRPFFTEGTELFSKGGLFYSRRIGGTPFHYYDAINAVGADEQMLKNPSQSKLINATKISGRTQKKLGIGFLNAITQTQYAQIENLNTKESRKFLNDPLTNYNVFVLDQAMKHNSSVTLINTNVMRSGTDYDANVTAGLFDLNDKSNTWNIGGKIAVSQLYGTTTNGKTDVGYNHNFYFGKVSGKFNFNVYQELMDKKYTNQDLAYFTNNNYINHGVWAGYSWIEPKKWHNQMRLNFNGFISQLYAPVTGVSEKYQMANMNVNFNVQTKKLWWVGGLIGARTNENDFYEPRKSGYYFQRKGSISYDVWINSNEAKRYSFYAELFGRNYLNFYGSSSFDISLKQSYRVNKKLTITQSVEWMPQVNNIGYTKRDTLTDNVIFARRKRNTFDNILNVKYSFTNKMGITFRMRHYLSYVDNKEFFKLENNGQVTKDPTAFNDNQNVNFFNIDMVYTWEFAPGSFLNVVWKNNIYTSSKVIERDYFKNLGDTWQSDQNNNLSIKLIYFLDYQNIKKWMN